MHQPALFSTRGGVGIGWVTVGITEDDCYEGLSSGLSKLEAGHLPVFESTGVSNLVR